MKIVGILLIILGVFWFISRLMNQPIMMRNYKNGDFSAFRYFYTELLTGFGFGVLLIIIGYLLVT